MKAVGGTCAAICALMSTRPSPRLESLARNAHAARFRSRRRLLPAWWLGRTFGEELLARHVSLRKRSPSPSYRPHTRVPETPLLEHSHAGRGSRFTTAIERPRGPDTLLTALVWNPLNFQPRPERGSSFVGPLRTPRGGLKGGVCPCSAYERPASSAVAISCRANILSNISSSAETSTMADVFQVISADSNVL